MIWFIGWKHRVFAACSTCPRTGCTGRVFCNNFAPATCSAARPRHVRRQTRALSLTHLRWCIARAHRRAELSTEMSWGGRVYAAYLPEFRFVAVYTRQAVKRGRMRHEMPSTGIQGTFANNARHSADFRLESPQCLLLRAWSALRPCLGVKPLNPKP